MKNIKVPRFAHGVPLSTVLFTEQTSCPRRGHRCVSDMCCVIR